MQTKLDRQISIINRFQSEMLSAFRMAKGKSSFEWILEQHNARVYEKEDYKKLPRWARSQIQGYSAALLDFNYENLEFGHIYDGVFTLKLPYGPTFDQKKVQDSYHVWKGTEIKF